MRPGLQSLKSRLFFWSLLITTSLLIILGYVLHLEIKKAIYRSVEQTLHSKVQILKGLMHEEHGAIELELAEIVLGEYSIPRSGHYYKVLLEKEVFAASPSLIDEDFNLESDAPQYSNDQLNEKVFLSVGPANEPIMAVRHDFTMFNQSATVYAAQSLEESIALINKFKHVLFIAIPASIGILTLTGLWITRKSMKPLEKFSSAIEKITHKTMNERIAPALQVSEVKNIANSFNAMLDRLQRAFDTEKRLVSDASHELKTPLSVIKAQCDVLLQDNDADERYRHELNRIKSASDNMNKLIRDMLSLARLDSGSISAADFTAVSLHECIDNALKFAKFSAAERDIKITRHIPEDIKIPGDRDMLTEVFLNIIDNAIKYNKPGGNVEITVTRNKDKAEVVVQDSGEGITKKDLDRIFDRFYRADASRNREGTGLGLSITKAIVEIHRGLIDVTNEPGQGTCFILTFPLHLD